MGLRSVGAAIRSGHWPTLVGAWLHLTVSFMVWVLFGALIVAIGEEFRLSPAQQSFLVAVPLLTGAAFRILAGWACDWWGAKRTGLVVLGLQVIAVFWAAAGARSYLEVLAVGALLGMGGASFAIAMPVASRAYPAAHQGLALGLVASGNVGTVLVLALAPRWETTLGWHAVCGLMAIPVGLSFAIFAWTVRDERPHRGAVSGAAWWHALAAMAGRRRVYWVAGVYGITFGGFVGLASFLPLLLHETHGTSLVIAGSIAAACSLVGSAIRPAGGYLADRWGGLRMLFLVLLAISVAVIVAGQPLPLEWAAGAFVVTVGLMGLGNGVVFQIVAEWFPEDIGLASGLVGAAGSLGGFLLPIWFSGLRQMTGGYWPGFVVLAILSAAVAFTVGVLERRRPVMVPEPGKVSGFSG